MDLFPDGARVRLRSRLSGNYFHAEEDGLLACLRPHRASLNSVWAVHRVERGGAAYVLLHGAAYGRYLAVCAVPAPMGLAGSILRFAQVPYDDTAEEEDEVFWQFIAAGDDGNDDVLLSSRRYGVWPPGEDVALRWVVEVVPPRPEPPVLPGSDPPIANGGGLPARPEREIRYVRADEEGNFQQLEWETITFHGLSVFDLRRDLANQLDVEDELNITLCVQAGFQGRLTPLVVDLPTIGVPMDIVVLDVGSPAANALVYPDVDAP